MVQAVRELDRYSKSEIEECSELLQYIYVNDDECFVRVLNKSTGKNKVYGNNGDVTLLTGNILQKITINNENINMKIFFKIVFLI